MGAVKTARRWLAGLGLALAAVLLIVAAVAFWYTHRPLPPAVADELLFPGITYTREVRDTPRPLVIHLVRIDLRTPGLRFFVTPPDPSAGMELRGQTTSAFLARHELQLAINGSYFTPWWSRSPFDYYPHVGDPVNVTGIAIADGARYSEAEDGIAVLYISRDNRVSFDEPIGEPYQALAGNVMLLIDGVPCPPDAEPYAAEPQPRTAVAVDEAGTTLLLLVVDGRQPNYSEGTSYAETAAILREFGGYTGLNLDGGGSTTLVIEGADGRPRVLNSPIDNRIPGRERPVASHLGVYVERGVSG